VDETGSYAHQRNEGEGNKTAAREYNEAQRRFVESGKVEEKAREAARAMTSPERAELERAEAIGRRGPGQTLTQEALDQAAHAGEYVARNVQEYPFGALLLAGILGYGIGYLFHGGWSHESRKSLAQSYPSNVLRPPGYVG
jgi:hypothetical protein